MIDFSGGRERPVNYIGQIATIADSYPEGTPHGVQKDFIQNAMDARHRRGEPVGVRFRLLETEKGTFFTMEDSNTIGLTGPVLMETAQYEDDLPDDFHWARFEAFAFTKHDPDAIGARGQGKFIFMGASEDFTMLYDSLRDDGVYRLGATRATQTGCPIAPSADEPRWENDLAAQKLRETTGLPPLNTVGTRVIIPGPTPQFMSYLASGEFKRAIQETWFRSLEKKQLRVWLCLDSEEEIVAPDPFPLPTQDASDHKVWLLGKDTDDDQITISRDESYRVKHFHVTYYHSGQVDEDLRGITILHNGMKVTSLPMTVAPPEVRKRVIGYIEFDRDLDRELRKGINQLPNHYDLKWRRTIPRAIKSYVNEQLQQFGRQKLGLGVDPREAKRRRQTSAEEWAFRQLHRHARDLDLFGSKGGQGPGGGGGGVNAKTIGVRISDFSFPDPDIAPRVNWGSTFDDITAMTFNRTDTDRSVSVTCSILHGDSVVAVPIDHVTYELQAHRSFAHQPFSIEIDDSVFAEAGEYRLKAAMFDADTGDRIDSVVRRFWVERDPPLRRPFELEAAPGFPEPYDKRQWLIEGEINRSPTFLYNVSHPAYSEVEEDEEEQGYYLLQIMLEGAMQFVLRRPDREDGQPDYHPLDTDRILGGPTRDTSDIPEYTVDEVARYLSEIRWRIHA